MIPFTLLPLPSRSFPIVGPFYAVESRVSTSRTGPALRRHRSHCHNIVQQRISQDPDTDSSGTRNRLMNALTCGAERPPLASCFYFLNCSKYSPWLTSLNFIRGFSQPHYSRSRIVPLHVTTVSFQIFLNSPFSIHHPPSTFTVHHPPFTIHSPSAIHHSPFTIHYPPSTIHRPQSTFPINIHHLPSVIHLLPFTINHPPFTIHHPLDTQDCGSLPN